MRVKRNKRVSVRHLIFALVQSLLTRKKTLRRVPHMREGLLCSLAFFFTLPLDFFASHLARPSSCR